MAPDHGFADRPDDASNPYRTGFGADDPAVKRRLSADPSIEHEPHLQAGPLPDDLIRANAEAEQLAERRLYPDAELTDTARIEHTVWDEPALSGETAGAAPEDQLTYARWLDRELVKITPTDTWNTTLLVALAAGPWGIVGALISQAFDGSFGFSGIMGAVLLAPVTEEITKVAAALWVVEKRPFWFGSPMQIMLCAAAGGLAFAMIENLMYLGFYAPGQGPAYVAWRLVVCTSLHLVCSTIAGVGLVKIWQNSLTSRRRPELADGMPLFATAMVVHGLYNATVTLAEVAGVLSFG